MVSLRRINTSSRIVRIATTIIVTIGNSSSSWSSRIVDGFAPNNNNFYRTFNTAIHRHHDISGLSSSSSRLHVYAPPGSGYVRSTDIVHDDEENENIVGQNSEVLTSQDISQISPRAFPRTYEPMLEYPGTMRPGRTPENMPYHDLPFLNVDDPNPVPWPHFQEIEWHHKWEPPHEQALAMEEFIEDQGRWASVEDEAEMRMGMRRGVRERTEMEEAGIGGGVSAIGIGGGVGGEQAVIMDDDDEEEDEEDSGGVRNLGLGDGVSAFLKNSADFAVTTRRSAIGDDNEDSQDELDDDILGDDEGDEDDFLLDLGLGDDVGDVNMDDDEDDILSEEEEESFPTASELKMEATSSDVEDDEDDDLDLEDNLDLGFELGFDLDEEGDIDNVDDDDDDDFGDFDEDDDDMSLDDYAKEDDVGDDDEFDDGGFDYGDDSAY